ncbi:MAG: fatty acid CoA ligase family protein [Fimbriiglobus sp.]|jgi:acyl-CoA synthetase (AMP-forming)/AMP-acid ligase II|nr:fatty acid CoA ligase family protein [Fimbriiglobus sp.]
MTTTLNVASHLARMAGKFPDRPAVHVPIGHVNPHADSPHRTLTYRELNADADVVAHGLASLGIGRGTRVALMVPPGADFFALTFALFKLAAVPVMIDPGMGVKNLGTCLGEAVPEAFIGIPKAHVGRRVFGWAKTSVKVTVNVGGWRFFCTRSVGEVRKAGAGQGAYPSPDVTADDLAAILFTSGSTGVAKGAEYTHGIFAAQVELLKAVYGIEPGEVDLCTFPLFALFGPALGMACVVPDMDASRPATINPARAISQIRQFGVTQMFGSPAVLRNLASGPRERAGDGQEPGGLRPPLATLRRVISAGAPARVDVLEAFTQLLPPGVQVFTPYGATEALPVANIGSDEILGETRFATEQGKGVCVGRTVPGVMVHVIRISDDPIPTWDESLCVQPGVVGEFVIRGPVVTKRYFKRDAATKLAKILDERTGEVLHRMGDVGYVDDRGRLWFCGRKSHRVETPHGTYFTDMVEPIFNALAGRTALVGVKRRGVQHPVVCVEQVRHPKVQLSAVDLRNGWELLVRQLRQVGNSHNHTARIRTFVKHDGPFPVDVRHNSKIFREKLAVWADQQLGPDWTPEEAK